MTVRHTEGPRERGVLNLLGIVFSVFVRLRGRERCVYLNQQETRREGSKRHNYSYGPIPIALRLFALNIFLIADNLSHLNP